MRPRSFAGRRVVVATIALGFAGLLGAALVAPRARPADLHEIAGPTMGAHYVVKIAGRLDRAALDRARRAVEEQLGLVDRLMSTWRDDSELMRFNRHASRAPLPLSRETIEVFEVARRVATMSGGAFDVTVEPLVRLWGFGPDGVVRRHAPGADEIARARAAVGADLLAIDASHLTLAKLEPLVRCDLSGIAAGYAADRITRSLSGLGHGNALVDVAGEIRASGRRVDGQPWQVGIAAPPDPGGGSPSDSPLPPVSVSLDGLALATSGDYRNAYVDEDGVRRSHLIDPRTGRPVAHGLTSATAVHLSGAMADALATTLMVLGPEDGLALAEREGLPAYLVVRRIDGRLASLETRAFTSLRTP